MSNLRLLSVIEIFFPSNARIRFLTCLRGGPCQNAFAAGQRERGTVPSLTQHMLNQLYTNADFSFYCLFTHFVPMINLIAVRQFALRKASDNLDTFIELVYQREVRYAVFK